MIYTKIYSILGASVSGWVPTSGKSDAHWGHSDWPWRLSSGSLSKRKGKLRHLWKKGLLKYFGSQCRRRGDSGNADNFCVGSGDYLAPVVKPRKPSLKKLVFLGHPIEQEWFCYGVLSCFCYGFLLWIFVIKSVFVMERKGAVEQEWCDTSMGQVDCWGWMLTKYQAGYVH